MSGYAKIHVFGLAKAKQITNDKKQAFMQLLKAIEDMQLIANDAEKLQWIGADNDDNAITVAAGNIRDYTSLKQPCFDRSTTEALRHLGGAYSTEETFSDQGRKFRRLGEALDIIGSSKLQVAGSFKQITHDSAPDDVANAARGLSSEIVSLGATKSIVEGMSLNRLRHFKSDMQTTIQLLRDYSKDKQDHDKPELLAQLKLVDKAAKEAGLYDAIEAFVNAGQEKSR